MTNIDKVSDMITRIRNSNLVKAPFVKVRNSKLTLSIAKVLKQEGFINIINENDLLIGNDLILGLKYKLFKNKPYITNIIKVSSPGQRVYFNNKNVPRILGGIGVAILSTPLGILTDNVARASKVGGEVLFYIWFGFNCFIILDVLWVYFYFL